MAPTIQILDPRAEDVPEEVGLNSNLLNLKGKVVGLLENRKYHADAFLQELKDVLIQDYGAQKLSTLPSLATAHPALRKSWSL